MTDKTLSSKIEGRYSFDGKMERLCLSIEDVKDFIQKLKDEIIPLEVCYEGDCMRCKIDKLAGDALIHSPETSRSELTTEDTPEVLGKTSGKASGTHSQQGCGKCENIDFVKSEIRLKPIEIITTNPACTNCGHPKEEEKVIGKNIIEYRGHKKGNDYCLGHLFNGLYVDCNCKKYTTDKTDYTNQ